jgi:hypothetical protein
VVTGLVEFCLINRAVGVLIGQGHHPDTARTELQHRGARAGTTRTAAQHLLDEQPYGTGEENESNTRRLT